VLSLSSHPENPAILLNILLLAFSSVLIFLSGFSSLLSEIFLRAFRASA